MAGFRTRSTSYGRPAIPDLDIYRAANSVMRADDLPEAGDFEGQRIIAAIKELKSMEPTESGKMY